MSAKFLYGSRVLCVYVYYVYMGQVPDIKMMTMMKNETGILF